MGVAGKPSPKWPLLPCAYPSQKDKMAQYIQLEDCILTFDKHVATEQIAKDIKLADEQFDFDYQTSSSSTITTMLEFINELKSEFRNGLREIKVYDMALMVPKLQNFQDIDRTIQEVIYKTQPDKWIVPRLKVLLRNILTANTDLKNGTRVSTPSKFCSCGFKHFVDGQEYDFVDEYSDIYYGWNYGTGLFS